jgi:hypothetical protein
MKEIRVPHIKQVKISLLQNGDRPASVACCSGWAKWSQHSNLLSLSIEVALDAGTTDRLLQHLSSGEGNFNLEIQSRTDVGPTMVKHFPNCRTEIIECKFGPLLPANSVGIRYCFKIRTENAATRTNREVPGTGGDTKDIKAWNPQRRVSVFKTKRVRGVTVGR